MPKKIYKSDQQQWKSAHYGMTHEEWNKWNREYKKVRPLVLERDNNTCQICHGKSDKIKQKLATSKKTRFQIVVHHIKKVRDGGSNELNNLVTLCQFCNVVIDHYIPQYERWFGKLRKRKSNDKSGMHHKNYYVSVNQMILISKKYHAICDKIAL